MIFFHSIVLSFIIIDHDLLVSFDREHIFLITLLLYSKSKNISISVFLSIVKSQLLQVYFYRTSNFGNSIIETRIVDFFSQFFFFKSVIKINIS